MDKDFLDKQYLQLHGEILSAIIFKLFILFDALENSFSLLHIYIYIYMCVFM